MHPRDEELPFDAIETMLADCLERPAGQRSSAVDEACRAHPELADELRARVSLLEELDGSIDSCEATGLPERLGDYRLLSCLGGGGMGVVYLAEQISLGREVALKLVRPDQLYFPGARERFRREAESIARLQHRGIVPIHTVGEHQGIPYFAMERVRGCTLAEVLADLAGRDPAALSGADLAGAVAARAQVGARVDEYRALSHDTWTDTCLHVVREVALALQHAHERGVVHRDVKPSNVLVDPEGRVLLCDFGLSSDSGAERLTRSNARLGTLPYMSPEQAAGGAEPGPAADVYGLGVTLYELLTLQLPFQGDSATETLQRISAGRPDPIRVRNRRVAVDVETVCLTAMERDRDRRYGSAAALAADLGALLERRPVRARPPGPALRLRRAVQRRPALATAVVLGALLLVGLPTQRWWHTQQRLDAEQAARIAAQREVRLTQEAGHFMLELFRDAVSGPPDRTLADAVAFDPEAVAASLPTDRTARARAETLLARTLYEMRRVDEAEPLAEAALAHHLSQTEPVERRGLSVALLLTAQIAVQQGRAERAEKRIDQLFELFEEAPPLDRSMLESAHVTRAELLILQADMEAAEELLTGVLARLEARPDVAPAELGSALGVLGGSLAQKGEHERALPLLERALEQLEREHAGAHPDVHALLVNIGLQHKVLGQPDAAAEYYERALAMAGSVWSDANLNKAALLFNLGALEDTRGEYERSFEAYRDALDEFSALGLADSRSAMMAAISMGAMLGKLERWQEAEDVMVEWHPELERHVGPGHGWVGANYRRRARCRMELGDTEGADELIERGLAGLGEAEQATRRSLLDLRDQLKGR